MDYLIVAAAGFFGAVSRYVIINLIGNSIISPFPLGTFFVNITGSFFLGLFMSITVERLKLEPRLRIGIATGLFGAYTTFSTYAVESVNLFNINLAGLSLIYILTTPIGCILLGWIGFKAGRILSTKEKQES